MAYYTNFINGWNSATQPPSGVTGTALTGLTTANKLAAINAWTVTGAVPTVLNVTGAQVLNCINWTEFNALTAAQQQNILLLCAVPGQLLGGSSNTAFMVDGMLLAYFTNHSGPTILALTALAQSTSQPWWQFSGYLRPFDMGDVTTAGLS
jgi:hypothetical protein